MQLNTCILSSDCPLTNVFVATSNFAPESCFVNFLDLFFCWNDVSLSNAMRSFASFKEKSIKII